jgi:adenylate cyclase
MSRRFKALAIGLLAGAAGLALTPFYHHLEENLGLDLLFRIRGPREAPPEVAIVTLDRVSADRLAVPPEPEKWPRYLHARLIDRLAEMGAKAVAFDIFFGEPRSPDQDQLLAAALKRSRNVVLCESLKREVIPLPAQGGADRGKLEMEKLLPPVRVLAESAAALAPFPLPKVPLRVSQFWTFKSGAGEPPTLPVVMLHVFLRDHHEEFMGLMRRAAAGLCEIPDAGKDSPMIERPIVGLMQDMRELFCSNPEIQRRMVKALNAKCASSGEDRKAHILASLAKTYGGEHTRYLNFYGPPGTILTIPFYLLVSQGDTAPRGQEVPSLARKAVFVGLSERMRPEQKDGFYTVFSQPSGVDISGVEIAATAFANLLEDLPVRPLPPTAVFSILFFWGILAGMISFLLPASLSALCLAIASGLYLVCATYLFKEAALWTPLVIPLLAQVPFAFFGALSWKYLETNKERENIRRAIGYYLPTRIVDRIAQNIEDLKAAGQTVHGTCLFTDAERYTTISEAMEPHELHSFMNQYFETLFEPITRFGGIVAEVLGDGVMAVWAAAQPDDTLRRQACLAAIDIADRVHRFNESPRPMKLPTRIGLHAGHMFLGSVGAINHYEYRPTGDMVNTASRIEGLNKKLGTEKLATAEVLHQVNGILTRELGDFLLVGKSRPVQVYELICRQEEANPHQEKRCDAFARGLQAYRERSWDAAVRIFSDLLETLGDDGPARFYLGRCRSYQEIPPGRDWHGVIVLDSK